MLRLLSHTALALTLSLSFIAAPQISHAQEVDEQEPDVVLEPNVSEQYKESVTRRFQSATMATPSLPDGLKQMVSEGAQAKYLGEYEQMHGWVVLRRGQPNFYYVTPNGRAIIRGFLFGPDGEMVTGEQLTQLKIREGANLFALSKDPQEVFDNSTIIAQNEQSTPNTSDEAVQAEPQVEAKSEAGVVVPDLTTEQEVSAEPTRQPTTRADQFFNQLPNTNWFLYGEADKPYLYAFIDPECQHCQTFLKTVEPYVQQGFVSIRVIPVAFSEAGRKMAAYLLAAPNPSDILERHVDGDPKAMLIPGEISEDGVQPNLMMMAEWSLDATPIITYRGLDGQVKLIRGAPDDTRALIQDVVSGFEE